MPQLFNQMYAYDGFCLNLCYLMLKLSVPFSEPQCDKLLKVQPTYCSVEVNDNDKSQQKNIHAFGKLSNCLSFAMIQTSLLLAFSQLKDK